MSNANNCGRFRCSKKVGKHRYEQTWAYSFEWNLIAISLLYRFTMRLFLRLPRHDINFRLVICLSDSSWKHAKHTMFYLH